MRILIVHQYFKTPNEGFGIRTYHIAKAFVEKGHEVIVLSGHDHHSGLTEIDGLFWVYYFPIPYSNKFGVLKRLLAFVRFVRECRKYLRHDHFFDLAYVLTTPLSTAYIALHLKARYKIPYAFEVGDLWPAIPIRMGIINNPILKKYFYRLEKRAYLQAQFLIALSPPIQEYMERCVNFNKLVHVAPNMADCEFFTPTKSRTHFTHKNPFRICYAGTFGVANGLGSMMEVAQSCLIQQLPVEFTSSSPKGPILLQLLLK